MNLEQKLAVIKEVLDELRYDGDSDFMAEVSDDLVELLSSITRAGENDSKMELRLDEPTQKSLFEFLHNKFYPQHPVWSCIDIVKEEKEERVFPSMEST